MPYLAFYGSMPNYPRFTGDSASGRASVLTMNPGDLVPGYYGNLQKRPLNINIPLNIGEPIQYQFETLSYLPDSGKSYSGTAAAVTVFGIIFLALLMAGGIIFGVSFYNDSSVNTQLIVQKTPINIPDHTLSTKHHNHHHPQHHSPHAPHLQTQKLVRKRSILSDITQSMGSNNQTERVDYIDGIIPEFINNNVEDKDLCFNFYSHACGNYDGNGPKLQSDRQRNLFQDMQKENDRIVKTLVLQNEGKIGHFFHSCVNQFNNSELIQHGKSDETLIKLLLQTIYEFEDTSSISHLLGWAAAQDITLPFQFSLELNPLDAKNLIPTFIKDSVSEGKLANVDKNLLSQKDQNGWYKPQVNDPDLFLFSPWYLFQIAENKQWLPKGLFDERSLESWASAAFVIETQSNRAWLASNPFREYLENLGLFQYLALQRDQPTHFMPFSQVQPLLWPLLNLDQFFNSLIHTLELENAGFLSTNNHQDPIMWILDQYYFKYLNQYLKSSTVWQWKGYLMYSLLANAINRDLNPQSRLQYTYHHEYNMNFALPWKRASRFTPRDYAPAIERKSIEDRCLETTLAYLPVLVDHEFFKYVTSTFFNNTDWDTAEKEVLDLVEHLKMNLQDSLMEYYQETKDPLTLQAAQKIPNIEAIIMVPDIWESEKGPLHSRDALEITETNTFLDNILTIRKFHQKLALMQSKHEKRETRRKKHEMDYSFFKHIFDLPIHQVNAFYHGQLNSIIINAGILLPPFYEPSYDPISKFSKAAVVIGHELTHSIDYSGIMFQQDGSFCPPDPNLLSSHFTNSLCFTSLYSDVTPLGNKHNSLITLNENIADISGITLAYKTLFETHKDIYLAPYTNSVELPLDHLKYQFFLSYGQLWCASQDKILEQKFIQTSTHSVPAFRVNKVLQQIPDFLNIFNCNPTQNHTPDVCNLDSLFLQ